MTCRAWLLSALLVAAPVVLSAQEAVAPVSTTGTAQDTMPAMSEPVVESLRHEL